MDFVDSLMSELDIARQTVIDWRSFVRDIFTDYILRQNTIIGGPGIIVQIDETHFVKRKYHRGRVEVKVFGVVDIEGNCFMHTVDDRKKETLMAIISKRILPGSVIISDEFRSYSSLSQAEHHTVWIRQQGRTPHKQDWSNLGCWRFESRKRIFSIRILVSTYLDASKWYLMVPIQFLY